MAKEQKHWTLTMVIIATVVITSAVMIYNFRDVPGRLPVIAVSDGSNGVVVLC